MIYAHSLAHAPQADWQALSQHLSAVAERSAEFAKGFSSEEWARLIGLLHDLGKARASFQHYLERCNDLTDSEYDGSDHSHSGAGALLAIRQFEARGRIIAYCVAGHHAGLPDWIDGLTPCGALRYRLDQEQAVLAEPAVKEWIRENQPTLECPKAPWKFKDPDVSFWIRMLYSCLVDADFLDTEAFMELQKAQIRTRYPSLSELAKHFFEQLDEKQRLSDTTTVNQIRVEIRDACETAAELPPGLFSLTVPTGGGKTLSSTAFALRHAMKHKLQRIIYVIPYTSIIEQTADVLRSFFGADNVVEHHSNFDPDKETQQSRLASENWDAPIIVTTNVQFFESLYGCKSSRCRKLHNIAGSVVILDEAQLLPPRLLLPCVEAMRQLVSHYGVSMVLSTATQPALPGLENVCEIIPPGMNLYDRLKRTNIVLPENRTVRQTWEEIATELRQHDQVLCIVNTRKDCRELHVLMPEGTIHLSATLCGEHRSLVIATIKAMLYEGLPVRVISTQLVEAGVDIDFPVVYRAFTGLPSIAQAAGRCNREGLSPQPGRVVVFMPPKPAPKGELRKAEDTLSNLLATGINAESPESYPQFFKAFYSAQNDLGTAFEGWLTKDAHDFQFQFREAAAAFRMIDDRASATVIVRYGGNDSLIRALLAVGPKRDIMRRLQRFTVTVPCQTLNGLREKGFVEEPHPGVYVQTLPSLYSDVFGLDVYRDAVAPEDLMI
jgi:CRISPR-associated endonuclease/helicase Cas3